MITGSINIGIDEMPAEFFACIRDNSMYPQKMKPKPKVSYTEKGRKFIGGQPKSVKRVESMWRLLLLKTVAQHTGKNMMLLTNDDGYDEDETDRLSLDDFPDDEENSERLKDSALFQDEPIDKFVLYDMTNELSLCQFSSVQEMLDFANHLDDMQLEEGEDVEFSNGQTNNNEKAGWHQYAVTSLNSMLRIEEEKAEEESKKAQILDEEMLENCDKGAEPQKVENGLELHRLRPKTILVRKKSTLKRSSPVQARDLTAHNNHTGWHKFAITSFGCQKLPVDEPIMETDEPSSSPPNSQIFRKVYEKAYERMQEAGEDEELEECKIMCLPFLEHF